MASKFEESVQAVWHDPTSYQHLKHGPPYLPSPVAEPVKLSTEQKKGVRKKAADASILLAPSIPELQRSTLPNLLAALQASSMLHQMHHWMCSGPTFFADHGLFERLYNESLELIDQLAERAVGKGVVLTAGVQAESIAVYIGAFCNDSTDMVARSLKAEYTCLQVTDLCRADLEALDDLSHGLSKLLEDISDQHEVFAYILQQRSAPQKTAYDYDRT